MRILTIGNFSFGWDGSICDEEHIASALENAGHEVTRVQREETREANWKLPNADFALVAQWDGYADDLTVRLRFYTEKVVYWAFDYQADGQEWHEKLVKQSDLYLSKRLADSKYSNWQWLSQDFAPSFLDKYPRDQSKSIEVLFTGSYLPWATERNETLKAVDEKYGLHIYSVTPDQWKEQGFKNVFGPMMDDRLPQLIDSAKINLSIDHTIEAGYWSDRNAQIMACGGYVLSRYVPLAQAIFGQGVDYFYSPQDCLDRIEHALGDDEYREFVASVGYDIAHRVNRMMVDGRVYDLLTIVRGIL